MHQRALIFKDFRVQLFVMNLVSKCAITR